MLTYCKRKQGSDVDDLSRLAGDHPASHIFRDTPGPGKIHIDDLLPDGLLQFLKSAAQIDPCIVDQYIDKCRLCVQPAQCNL